MKGCAKHIYKSNERADVNQTPIPCKPELLSGNLSRSLIDYADMASGNIIYIKDGNYFMLGGDSSIIELDFSCSPNCSIRGYKTSQGDFPVGADRPNLDCEAGGIDCINVIDDGWTFYNLIVENGGDDCVSTNFA